MRFIVAKHPAANGTIVVISDQNIVGKKFLEGKRQLDLTVPFYQGKEESEQEVVELLHQGYILHLTGKAIIALAVEVGLVQAEQILFVQGVPHAQVVEG